LIEAESDAELELHCIGEYRSQPVWYRNGQQLDEDAQTFITVRVDSADNSNESVLTRMSDVDGQYQCRDATGYQADSDVLDVIGD